MTDLWPGAPTTDAVLGSAARLLEHMADPAVLCTTTAPGHWRIAWVNPAFEAFTGFSAAEVVGRAPDQLLGPLSEPDLLASAEAEVRDGGGLRRQTVLYARDGALLLCDLDGGMLATPPGEPEMAWSRFRVLDGDGEQFRAMLASREQLLAGELVVLEEMAASRSPLPVLRRVADVVEQAIPGSRCSIGMCDEDGVVRHGAAPSLDPELVALLDAEPADGVLGRRVRSSQATMVVEDISVAPEWGELGPAARRYGLRACWWFTVRDLGAGDLLGVVTIFHEQARSPSAEELRLLDRMRHLASLALERHRIERRLEHQAVHDGLTGLPNRTLLLDCIARALEESAETATNTAVIFLDLDRFKLVNDSLGHAVGDELLRQVGDRLRATVRRGDTLGRFGGDEFLVVAERVADEAAARLAAERLVSALVEPFVVGGARRVATASVGVALAGHGVDPDDLVRNADAAMYRAKDQGRNRIAMFEETLHAEVVRRYDVEHGLRTALDAGELVTLYQPCVRLADGQVTGVEALVRWDRPGHGLIGADELVPIAEDTGLIVPIGAWVLHHACQQAVDWDRDPHRAGLSMAVNLSARQLGDPRLVDMVEAELQLAGLDPERLCLEVTESALAGDPEMAVAAVVALKLLGVRIAIDDFGTGYATLDYVRRFSMADELKIDRSFVAGVADERSPDAAIVSAAIVLADALGFEVVAEGVETVEQLAVLRRLGCGRAQGFYFGRPNEGIAAVR